MVWYTGVDKDIYESGIHYRPQQKYLTTDYVWPTPDQGGGGGGGSGGSYGIPAASGNKENPWGGGIPTPEYYTPTWTSLPGDPKNFRMSQLEGTADYFPENQSWWDQMKDKWFQPKIRGELGDRLERQYKGTQKLPSFFAALARFQSPFNRDSANWNPEMASQLNFLEGLTTGKKLTGTSGNLKWVEDQMMIGRDPQSGLLKYGPGSVLSGKNVISGFGSNDYEVALNKYIDKMIQRGTIDEEFEEDNLSEFQLKKLQQARNELAAWKNQQKKEDADKGITHIDQEPITKILTTQQDDNTPTGKTDAWQETFSGTKDGGGEFAGTGPHSNQGGWSPGSGSQGTSQGGHWDSGNQDKGNDYDFADYNQGGRVHLNLGGIASVLGREGLAPGGPAGGASAGGDYGGNVNPEQEYAGSTFEERYGDGGGGGEEPPTVVENKNNLTVDSDWLNTSPSAEIKYTPSQWAQIMARLSNKDITSTDDIDVEGQFTGGNDLINYGIDFTDEGVTGGNVGLNYGDLNLRATTDLDKYNLGVNYNKGPFFVSGNIDNMGNKNIMGGVKWEFGKPEAPKPVLSYDDLIYGQGLRHGGLASIL